MRIGLPQSLFGRLLAGLLVAVGLTLIVIVVLIVRERRDLALWRSGAWSAASTIAEASIDLTELDSEARRAQVEEYRTQRRLIENMRPRPPQPRREILRIQHAFAEKVRAQLGPNYRVSVSTAHGRWRDVIPHQPRLYPCSRKRPTSTSSISSTPPSEWPASAPRSGC